MDTKTNKRVLTVLDRHSLCNVFSRHDPSVCSMPGSLGHTVVILSQPGRPRVVSGRRLVAAPRWSVSGKVDGWGVTEKIRRRTKRSRGSK